ncbi:MAG: heme ABC exporter ATP-binding protein CcmA [Acidobacteria bacterium]|nr:heme ABC exporter ATP-binding protein CcmA [Acidobacteriota bacterium]
MPPHASPDLPPEATSPRLHLRQLSKYFGRFVALDRLDLEVQPGELVVVLGPNGAGKTTLLRILALLQQPSEGELLFDDQPARRLPPAFRQRLGFVGHETFLYDELTVEENLRFYARLYALDAAAQRVGEVLGEMDIAPRARSPVRSLSRGLKQRVALARAWLHRPGLLLLDEPSTGLDPPARARLFDWLAACHRSGRTVILSSHDPAESLPLATRALLLERGRLALDLPDPPARLKEIEARLQAAN